MSSNREAAINNLKETANIIMGTLTLVLQISMNMIEIKDSHRPEEEEQMPQLTSQLQSMCQEMMRQRALLQRLAESQNRVASPGIMTPPQISSLPLVPLSMPGNNPGDPLPMPTQTTLSDEEEIDDAYSMVSSVKPTAIPKNLKSPEKKQRSAPSRVTTQPPALENAPMTSPCAEGPMRLTLAEWGQRKITWGKKHPGRTYFQVLSEDMGYFEWSLSRYRSLPPHQQNFVDFCRAQLENDAAQDRAMLLNVRRLA